MLSYKVIWDDDLAQLMADVSTHVEQGWLPTGGLSVRVLEWENERKGYTERTTTYYQAIYNPKAEQ